MTTPYSYLAAETTSTRFATITGLIEGRGFVLDDHGHPAGVYPTPAATQMYTGLTGNGIHVHWYPGVASHAAGRRQRARSAPTSASEGHATIAP